MTGVAALRWPGRAGRILPRGEPGQRRQRGWSGAENDRLIPSRVPSSASVFDSRGWVASSYLDYTPAVSIIPSLLRIMALRDADSLHIETAKVPELRRRGRAEPMALPALEAELIEQFVEHVTTESDREVLRIGSIAVTFVDSEGGAYMITIHHSASGYQLVARRVALARAPAVDVIIASPASERTIPEPSSIAPEPTVESARASSPADVAPPHRELAAAKPRWSPGPSLRAAIEGARERGASDLFVSTQRPVRLRIHGQLELAPLLRVDDEELHHMYATLTGLAHNASDTGSADIAVETAGARARCNVFSHLDGVGLAVRLLNEQLPELSDLGLPAAVAGAIDHREGLVLVCGPTGCGKTTTAAALLRQLDRVRAAHVITLEDPIEYRLSFQRGLVHQRELGTHVSSFAGGLRAALREAPDILFVGELRDRETIAAALTAAETGHLVLATMHAPGAAGAVDRMVDAFDQGRQYQVRTQLASCLRMVITQHLLPRRSGGRVAAAEVVPVTAAVSNIIRKGELQTLATAIQSGREVGMVPLERSLAQLVQSGVITEVDALRVACDAKLLRAQLG
jgi:twitching motility protein PilT